MSEIKNGRLDLDDKMKPVDASALERVKLNYRSDITDSQATEAALQSPTSPLGW